MSKKVPPPADMPPLPPATQESVSTAQVKEMLDQVLCVTLNETMAIAEQIRIDHGNEHAQGFILNLVSSVVASVVYACISDPSTKARQNYRLLKNNVQEAIAGGFHGGFYQHAPKSPTDFICRIEVMPETPNNLNH